EIHAEVGVLFRRQVEPEAGTIGGADRTQRPEVVPYGSRREKANNAKTPIDMLAPLDLLPQRHAVAPAAVHVGTELTAAELGQLLEGNVTGRSLECGLHGQNRSGPNTVIYPCVQQIALIARRSAQRRQVDAYGPLDEGASLRIE